MLIGWSNMNCNEYVRIEYIRPILREMNYIAAKKHLHINLAWQSGNKRVWFRCCNKQTTLLWNLTMNQ